MVMPSHQPRYGSAPPDRPARVRSLRASLSPFLSRRRLCRGAPVATAVSARYGNRGAREGNQPLFSRERKRSEAASGPRAESNHRHTGSSVESGASIRPISRRKMPTRMPSARSSTRCPVERAVDRFHPVLDQGEMRIGAAKHSLEVFHLRPQLRVFRAVLWQSRKILRYPQAEPWRDQYPNCSGSCLPLLEGGPFATVVAPRLGTPARAASAAAGFFLPAGVIGAGSPTASSRSSAAI